MWKINHISIKILPAQPSRLLIDPETSGFLINVRIMSTLMSQTPTQAQLNSSSFQPIQLTGLDTKDPWVHPRVSIVFYIYSYKSILGVLFYISFYELKY